jgi:hypothetical protein
LFVSGELEDSNAQIQMTSSKDGVLTQFDVPFGKLDSNYWAALCMGVQDGELVTKRIHVMTDSVPTVDMCN